MSTIGECAWALVFVLAIEAFFGPIACIIAALRFPVDSTKPTPAPTLPAEPSTATESGSSTKKDL